MSKLPLGAAKGLRVGDIVERLGGSLRGDAERTVLRIRPLDRAGSDDIAFLSQAGKRAWLESTQAGCVILPRGLESEAERFAAAIMAPDPYLYYARLAQWFAALDHEYTVPGVHAAAIVDPAAQVASTATVEACAVIERGAVVAEGAIIGAGCYVGRDAVIGVDSRLHPRVVVQHGCIIGARCIVHSGAVIGSDGFGYARDEQGAGVKIPQMGAVIIGDDVEIGANSTIDRGALDDTRIDVGVKIDNQVQIGHNVQIGAHTALAGCVGVAGSARIGAYCFIGGSAGILGHLDIADHVTISAMSLVTRSIHEPGHYAGVFPLDTQAHWAENAAAVRQLGKLRARIRQLEKRENVETDKTQALPSQAKP